MTTTSAAATTAPATGAGSSPGGPHPREVGKERPLQQYAVPAAAALAVLVRLPFLAKSPTNDEGGFLLVGQQWHSGGTSLYGNYWVDRPPLLITIFRFAAELGGVVPLRLIGCLATVLIVIGSAHVARRVGGERAARWTALTAAALCVSPLLGGLAVNGELLSAPFVVGGIAATMAAVDQRRESRAVRASALAGAAMVAAILVKQNMADVAVFAGVAFILAWRRDQISTARLRRSLAAFVAGSLVCLGIMAAWTMAHGTSVTGVFDAMYPFRVEAAHVMAASSRQGADARLWALMVSWLVSGGAVIMAVVGWALVSRRLRGVAVSGLIATVLFDVVSVTLGGSYWNHYLIQLVVPIAILAGLLVAGRQPAARFVLSACALAATISLAAAFAGLHTSGGTSVGQAVGRVADRQDTIITAWGHPDVTRASGLSSPYPYPWSLPARTLDPSLADLNNVLAGPTAPTWFIAWRNVDSWAGRGDSATTARLLTERYHIVTRLGRHTIYLRDGVNRAAPRLPGTTTASGTSRSPATTSRNVSGKAKP